MTRTFALRFACSLLVPALAASCAPNDSLFSAKRAATDYPHAGLFTPGSRIGYVPTDGGQGDGSTDGGRDISAAASAIAEAGGSDRCVDLGPGGGTPAMLQIDFKTASYDGFYAPKNCGAVWIEDMQGQYVATPAIWAGLRIRNLFIWGARRCRSDNPDIVTSATLDDHAKPHSLMWDCKDSHGHVVADGSYVLNIEVSEDEFNYGSRSQFPFDKGAAPFTTNPPDQSTVLGLQLMYAPAQP